MNVFENQEWGSAGGSAAEKMTERESAMSNVERPEAQSRLNKLSDEKFAILDNELGRSGLGIAGLSRFFDGDVALHLDVFADAEPRSGEEREHARIVAEIVETKADAMEEDLAA